MVPTIAGTSRQTRTEAFAFFKMMAHHTEPHTSFRLLLLLLYLVDSSFSATSLLTMDVAAFLFSAAATRWWCREKVNDDANNDDSLYYVTADNEELPAADDDDDAANNRDLSRWHRATYVLIMHDPPDQFYEPKEWSHTSVLLLKSTKGGTTTTTTDDNNEAIITPLYRLTGGPLRKGESHVAAGVRYLQRLTGIDVSQPENCLHHLFTFPFDTVTNVEGEKEQSNTNTHRMDNDDDHVEKTSASVATTNSSATPQIQQWADFMECVFRGSLDNLPHSLVRLSLADLKDQITETPELFQHETYYAMRLYFQRQMDLRAKRRLLKGYSSIDMERYGLREPIVLKADDDDSERGQALDFTMQTDDGMAPRLLHQADAVLLGVSRAGKTPLSLLLSQTKGIKVANIPLVLEVPPPRQLFQLDARKVFLITQDAEHLQHVRRERLRREMKRRVGSRSTYADPDYVRRDLENAKTLARDHGYTIIDITDRAMEEAASLIVSKLKERFPDKDFGDYAM